MALTKQKKQEIVSEVAELLTKSKLTVLASYPGTTVKAMQQLRLDASQNGTTVKVVKNRLVQKAVEQSGLWNDIDLKSFSGQLLYAFNSEDEVAPAQALATFAKTNPTLAFVGALTADGQLIGPDDVKALASLPSKDQLRAQLVGTIAAPLTGFVGVLSGTMRSIVFVLQARADSIA